ncbi:MAG TPA: Rrf2 family transcriptional regulator [Chitinophagaceae bacterium]|nr:Rrf2 family transcriptional regulator [Chitinophagaceae bacterium]
MLSLTCKAAIKAVIYLGAKADEEKCSIKEVAAYINENEHTVGKLLQKLVKANVINSSKGPTGGFYVNQAQKKQPILNIVEAIDGEEVFAMCGLGLSKCNEKHPCPLHNEYKKIREAFKNLCKQKKVSDLQNKYSAKTAFLKV